MTNTALLNSIARKAAATRTARESDPNAPVGLHPWMREALARASMPCSQSVREATALLASWEDDTEGLDPRGSFASLELAIREQVERQGGLLALREYIAAMQAVNFHTLQVIAEHDARQVVNEARAQVQGRAAHEQALGQAAIRATVSPLKTTSADHLLPRVLDLGRAVAGVIEDEARQMRAGRRAWAHLAAPRAALSRGERDLFDRFQHARAEVEARATDLRECLRVLVAPDEPAAGALSARLSLEASIAGQCVVRDDSRDSDIVKLSDEIETAIAGIELVTAQADKLSSLATQAEAAIWDETAAQNLAECVQEGRETLAFWREAH